jgi:adenylate cyclase, class 2
MPQEIEIKFCVANLRALESKLKAQRFRLQTPRTHEMNTLYDLPGQTLRKRKQLLRIRQYGSEWKITHKGGGKVGRHSSRHELETKVEDGKKMDAILRALGYSPSFRYEKFRAEWSDGKGNVVLDHTPIGDFAEIEGPPRWIDQTARKLGVSRNQYIMKNYATLFAEWKQETKSEANELTFKAVRRDRGESIDRND